jgi:hypothetical protein
MYRIDADGWLQPARHCSSDNFNQRPAATAVDLLVIHNISLPPGQIGGGFIEALFTNRLDCTADPAFADLAGLRVAAHLLIDRDGRVTQFVPLYARAWHAGQSRFEGRDNCNEAPTKCRTPMPNTANSPLSPRHCCAISRGLCPTVLSVTVISRPRAKPIRARLSTGPAIGVRSQQIPITAKWMAEPWNSLSS